MERKHDQPPFVGANLDVAAEGAGASPVSIGSERPAERTRFKFIFWFHDRHHVAAVVPHLQDCDILALEMIGQDDEHEREASQIACTALLSSQTSLEEKAAIAAKEQSIFGYGSPYPLMLAALANSNKQVVFVDALRTQSEYAAFEEMLAIHDLSRQAVNENIESNAAILGLLVRTALAYGGVNAARDRLIAEQLRLLSMQPSWSGKKVGVLLGAVHTSVQHQMSRRAPTERVFEGVGTPLLRGPHEQAHYAYEFELMRRASFHPQRPLPEYLLNRQLLQELYAQYDMFYDGQEDGDPGEVYLLAKESIQADIVCHLSDEEVHNVLAAIDGAKAQQAEQSLSMGLYTEIYFLLEEQAEVVRQRTGKV